MSLEEDLETIAKMAPELRSAGIARLVCAGVTIEFARHDGVEESASTVTPEEIEESLIDALNSESTYSLAPGADLPGFPRLARR